MTEPIHILIADDHTLFREGLKALFGSLPDTEIVGEAANGAEAVRPVGRNRTARRGVDGHSNARSQRHRGYPETVQTSPHIGVIIVTMFQG